MIQIRSFRAADHNFILNSWLRSWRNSASAKKYSNETYYREQASLIQLLLAISEIAIACNQDDPEQIFGYIVWQPDIGGRPLVHYIYVKAPFRQQGIARTLVDRATSGRAALTTHYRTSGKRLNLRSIKL